MASYVLTDAKIWVAQYDVSGDMNAVALASGAEAQEATTFGATARIRRGGLKMVDCQAEGFFNAGTDQVDEVLFSRIGSANQAIGVSPTGGAEGQPAYLFLAQLSRYRLNAQIGEMFSFTVEAESQGVPLIKGLVGLNGVKASNGSGTGFQLGAVAAGQRLYAGLHVLSGGGGTFTAKVQSDTTGFGSPTDQITFAGKTGPGFEWASVAGPVTDDFWRFTWTVSAGSFTVVGLFGIL